ncbi:hypothetical protein F4802DRAFT_484223 [Xylaria palmicola]|nr:hypothetical protein F4802DRAFT_484223 [Xylaria palmicola]
MSHGEMVLGLVIFTCARLACISLVRTTCRYTHTSDGTGKVVSPLSTGPYVYCAHDMFRFGHLDIPAMHNTNNGGQTRENSPSRSVNLADFIGPYPAPLIRRSRAEAGTCPVRGPLTLSVLDHA